MSTKALTIAIIPNKLLGDGVLSLVLANNLYKNNFQVTIFQDFIVPFNDWLPFAIKPITEDTIMEVLNTFDIVLADTYSNFTDRYSAQEIPALAREIIFYATGRLRRDYYHDHKDRLSNKLVGDKAQYIKHFANASRVIKFNQTNSMVENMVLYCSETLKLPIVCTEPGFSLPSQFIAKKHSRRVIIAPTSSNRKKEWSPQQFLNLARKLRADNYEVVFSFAPNERQHWQQRINNEFDTPEFCNIKNFAEFVYESALLIGNDSGAGHLASALGIPVLTLVTSPRKKSFRWRPGWGHTQVIYPYFTFAIMGRRFWRAFLPVKRVYNSFYELINNSGN